LAEIHRATNLHDVETKRATAQLLGLDITLLHRQSPHKGTEEIAIHLRVLPTVAALHHSLGSLHLGVLARGQPARLGTVVGSRTSCSALPMPHRQPGCNLLISTTRDDRARVDVRSGAAHGVTGGPS
jgi:hypothetical protein